MVAFVGRFNFNNPLRLQACASILQYSVNIEYRKCDKDSSLVLVSVLMSA